MGRVLSKDEAEEEMTGYRIKVKEGRFAIEAHIEEIGPDLLVSIRGGSKPHIGAIGMATPRPSLKDSKRWSATSSNLTFIGHKEDLLVKRISEELAAQLKRHVVVVAGLHWEGVTSRELEAIESLTEKLVLRILKKLKEKD